MDLLAKMDGLLANSNIHIVEGNEEGDSSEEEDEDEELFAIAKIGKCENIMALDMLLPILGGHPVQSIRCIPGKGLLNPQNYFCSLFTKLHVLHLEVKILGQKGLWHILNSKKVVANFGQSINR